LYGDYANQDTIEVTQELSPGWHTINLHDTYGDGWHGGYFEVLVNDEVLVGGPDDGLVSYYGRSLQFYIGGRRLNALLSAAEIGLEEITSASSRPISSASASPTTKEHLAKGGPSTPQVANNPRPRESFSPKRRQTSESSGNCRSRTTLNEIFSDYGAANFSLEVHKQTLAVEYGDDSANVCSSETVGITDVDAQNTCNAFCTESGKSGASSE
jgi:hypothetical protein